jgi:phage baseplate assembly protein W
MSYEIIRGSSIIKKPNTAYGIDISYNHNNGFKSLYNELDQITANLKHLILTIPGERYYHPTYGCNLLHVVFEQNIQELKEDIVNIISESIINWLPYLNITNIDIKTHEDDPLIENGVEITIETSYEDIDLNPVVIFINETGILTLK